MPADCVIRLEAFATNAQSFVKAFSCKIVAWFLRQLHARFFLSATEPQQRPETPVRGLDLGVK
jgi:hypothetical protein